ncbi:glycoside hydrolase superfamily [Cladochytrium replicatum]|nr:glycoside hydrolase superfamily [Cladochytrium replicatum]
MSSVSTTVVNWHFKQLEDKTATFDPTAHADGWTPSFSKDSPITDIYHDLLSANRIPDPFKSTFERDVQWVAHTAWLYRATFSVPALASLPPSFRLDFDGLDTVATVYLNGREILKSDNMFHEHSVDLNRDWVIEGENTILVKLDSAWDLSKEREKVGGVRKVWNGDSARTYVRKAQYHWGWDWGPIILTAGIFRPIRFVAFDSRVTDVHVTTTFANGGSDLSLARIDTVVTIERTADIARTLRLSYRAVGSDDTISSTTLEFPAGQSSLSVNTELVNPSLWWPNTHGAQHLYTVSAEILDGDSVLDAKTTRFGVRSIELVTAPFPDGKTAGTSFFFRVNNVPVYAQGSNWIPADNLLTRATPQVYREWLQLLADGNQNMVRVWGGGIYEHDVFYDTCDELGILVWQDFMFACGWYPADDAFVASVETEAIHNVRRLRNHPSLAIFAGNNEDYPFAESISKWQSDDKLRALPESDSEFPARKIYEITLPKVVSSLAPSVPYRFGSPYGGPMSDDATIGDIHQWNIWHGAQAPFQKYISYIGRFVSEFGMQAFPDLKTVKEFFKDEEEQKREGYPQSEVVVHHNKADGGERRIATYLVENLRFGFEMGEFVYATQWVQAEALKHAYRDWRGEWKGPGKEYNAGALVWQINDCWPVTSWATVDYYRRPKPAYHAIKSVLAPVTAVSKRAHTGPTLQEPLAPHITTFSATAQNLSLAAVTADLVVRLISIATGATVHEARVAGVQLASNATSDELWSTTATAVGIENPDSVVLAVRLESEGKALTSWSVDWPVPLKHLKFNPDYTVVADASAGTVTIEAKTPMSAVVLDADEGVAFDVNYLDVLPGEVVSVKTKRLVVGAEIGLRWFGEEGKRVVFVVTA